MIPITITNPEAKMANIARRHKQCVCAGNLSVCPGSNKKAANAHTSAA